jgi:nitroimidazol reductase NimA-like FMN-containing flavoprotein (pyridoxamine 5'-phosphate oxidase superfamily)
MTILTSPIRDFLQKPLLARMSTVGADGYPHTVPVWFMLDGDDLVVISVRKTAKLGHIKANPKGALQIGGDSNDGGGYLLKGEFSIEEDPNDVWMNKLIYRYESGEQAAKDSKEWAELDIIVVRMKVNTVLKV